MLDPIDGSINAKRGLPFFALSVAVAEGGTMGDVTFGYVYDFGTGEEWTAERGGGARLNGAPLTGEPPKERIELLALEATRTDLVARHVAPLVGLVHRLRIFGSLALSLCHLADGRVDAVCSLKAARSVDIAAAQLLVRERGLRDRPVRGAAVRGGAARPRGAFAGRRGRNARACGAGSGGAVSGLASASETSACGAVPPRPRVSLSPPTAAAGSLTVVFHATTHAPEGERALAVVDHGDERGEAGRGHGHRAGRRPVGGVHPVEFGG